MGVLLVTGGSRGIGAAIAKVAARKGYDVGINYVRARTRWRRPSGPRGGGRLSSRPM